MDQVPGLSYPYRLRFGGLLNTSKLSLPICRMKVGEELPGRVAVRIKEVDEEK